jgi:hypothetical protein
VYCNLSLHFRRKIFIEILFFNDSRFRVAVKALGYKPEGREFETRRSEYISSIHLILQAALGLEVHSASNRNEYRSRIMFLGNRARLVHRGDNLAAICEPVIWTMWDP